MLLGGNIHISRIVPPVVQLPTQFLDYGSILFFVLGKPPEPKIVRRQAVPGSDAGFGDKIGEFVENPFAVSGQ